MRSGSDRSLSSKGLKSQKDIKKRVENSTLFLVLMIGLEPIRFIQPRDFKSLASADSATSAYGGTSQIRTGA